LLKQFKMARRTWPAIVGLVFAFQSVAALADGPSLGFVDGSAVTLSPGRSGDFRLDLPIKNSGTTQGKVSLTLLDDKEGKCGTITPGFDPEQAQLPPNAIAIHHFTISGASLPATCFLALTDDQQRNTSLKQIKLAQQYITSAMSIALCVCVAISALVAIATFAAARKLERVSASYKLGSPAWDFAKSWTSTTTLASAVISTALTLSALPDLTRYASKSGYAALAMLISFVVIVAPFVFVAFRTGEIERDPATGQQTVFYQGSLWLFLLSGAMTLFASLAQVVVLFLLLSEIFLQNDQPFSSDGTPWLALMGGVPAVALLVALCRYVGHSMFLTVKLQKEADAAPPSDIGDETVFREKYIAWKANGFARRAANHRLTWPVL
jgi:hypothetical protein